MASERRGLGGLIRGTLLCALLIPATSACSAVVGGGIAIAVVAVGALTSHCYDYLDVSVYDAQGRKTCTATVTATNGGDQFELQSCYYAPLTDGHWTLRAAQPGYVDSATTVDVDHAQDCTRHVQSVELTLAAPGAAAVRAPKTDVSTLIPASPAAPAAPPAAPPSAPADALPLTPPASSAVTPSVGVFPDSSQLPH